MARVTVPWRTIGRWVLPVASRTIHGTTRELALHAQDERVPCLCRTRITLPPAPPARVSTGPGGLKFCDDCLLRFSVIPEPHWGSVTDHYPDWLRGSLPE